MASGKDYQHVSVLGRGGFGVVKKVLRKADSTVLACKVIHFRDGTVSLDEASQEYFTLAVLQHPHIVRYVDYFWQLDKAKLYMEYCQFGDLQMLIDEQRGTNSLISEKLIGSVMAQVASALIYCHYGIRTISDDTTTSNLPENEWDPILHRDIKPANVLVSYRNGDSIQVKLGDFGLAKLMDDETALESYAGTHQYQPPVAHKDPQQKRVLTPWQEIDRSRRTGIRWTKKSDIFSLGCTLFAMCNLEPPFAYRMEELDPTPVIRDTFSDKLRKCIMSCLAFYPEHRHDAFDLLRVAQRLLRNGAVTEVSVWENTLDGTLLNFECKTSLSSVENSPISQQVVENTTDSSMDNESPGKELQVESRIRNTENQTHGSEHPNLPNKSLESQNTQLGRSQLTATPVASLKRTSESEVLTKDLVQRESIINAMAGDTDQTPLFSAAANGHHRLVQLLLNKGANVHAKNVGDGFTALHTAVERGYKEVAQVLLEMGADVNVQATGGWTALHLAAQNGHIEAARTLLAKSPNVNATAGRTNQTPLFSAAANGHEELVLLLLEHKANIHASNIGDGFMALHIATQGQHAEAVQLLLVMGANVDAETKEGHTALHLAAQNGDMRTARILLDAEPNVNAKAGRTKQTPLYSAAAHGHEDLVQLLFENGAEIHVRGAVDGFMPLHIAAQGGHEKVVRKLLAAGAQRDAKAANGWTALHIAAQNGHEETALLLLD